MLTLAIELIAGRYDAATSDRSVAEWPPHPARAFCGLVASARTDAEWGALRWLERQPPPDVWVSRSSSSVRREGYVVTNKSSKGGGSQFHPGRSNLLRGRVSAQPESPQVCFVWQTDAPDANTRTQLTNLARRLPYFGRSTAPALADITDAHTPSGSDVCYQPGGVAEGSPLRIPYPGYVDALREQYEVGQSAWMVGRERGYVLVDEPTEDNTPAVRSPFEELLVFRFKGFRPQGALGLQFATAFRRAIMSIVPDPLPAALHGHDRNQLHAAFIALPNVGSEHSDGDLLGLALALPPLRVDERRHILRAIVGRAGGEDAWRLNVPGLGTADVSFEPNLTLPWGATVARWQSQSKTWATATPLVFDRHPKRGDDIEAFVIDSFDRAGYPCPRTVALSPSPLLTGATAPRRGDQPEWLRGRLMRHVQVEFDRAVSGPILVGAGRYLGLGLFAAMGPPR